MSHIGEHNIDGIPDPEAWIQAHERPEASEEGVRQIVDWAVTLNSLVKQHQERHADETPARADLVEGFTIKRDTIMYVLSCVFPADPVEGFWGDQPDYWKIRFQAQLREQSRSKSRGSSKSAAERAIANSKTGKTWEDVAPPSTQDT